MNTEPTLARKHAEFQLCVLLSYIGPISPQILFPSAKLEKEEFTMRALYAHNVKPQKTLELKAVIASLLDQAMDKLSFVDRDDPIFTLDIRMLRQAALLLQKMQ